MNQELTTQFIELLLVLPIIFLSIRKNSWKLIALCFLFYFISSNALRITNVFPQLNFIESTWNWSGKIYSILVSIVFYFALRNKFKEYDFVTIKQAPNSLKPFIIISALVLLFGFLNAYFLFYPREFTSEELLFQSTMPGLDEEISYRGILLGLLLTALKPSKKLTFLKLHPAIWITSIWFALAHSFSFDADWNVSQDWLGFFNSLIFALALGWIAYRSRSILIPIVLHNVSNVLVILTVSMIK